MLHLLWDASEIWGPLAEWALRSMRVPFRIVRAAEVADGLPARENPALLFVPGGSARHKAAALGPAGLAAVRTYVERGGQYLGFCGGAGLALSGDNGLELCPWGRAGFANRMQHFMSGHLFVTALPHDLTPPGLPPKPLLPVWWPGRFAPQEGNGVTALAVYGEAGPDFQAGDGDDAAEHNFLRGQPCMVHGAYGAGGYTLSYCHLETPDSPAANLWLAHLLRRLGGFTPACGHIPAWDVENLPLVWDDPDLLAVADGLAGILQTGLDAGLFFTRTPWLTGWKVGQPGALLNALRAQIRTALSRPPCPAAKMLWDTERASFLAAFRAFGARAVRHDAAEREELYGVPGPGGVRMGGLANALLALPDELAYLQLQ